MKKCGRAPLWRVSAGVFLLLAFAVAAQHPLSPTLLGIATVLVVVLAWRRPGSGVLLLAASLPVVDAGILTGPWLFDELDALVLAVLAGSSLVAARTGHDDGHADDHASVVPSLWLYVGMTVVVALAGYLPVLLARFDPSQPEPSLSLLWQSTKAFVWAALLVAVWSARGAGKPLWWVRHWLCGCAIGLGLVCLTALWELMLDGGWPVPVAGYRTVAAFWEMRLGGGAIDAYLALTLPMLFWLLLRERQPVRWWGLALLTLAAVQVLMSTQSRAVTAAVVLVLPMLALLVRRHPHLCRWRAPQRRRAVFVLLVMVFQILWGALGGGDLQRRLSQSPRDLTWRIEHWQRGAALLETPAERWLGLGAGQWSGRYGSQPGPGEFAGWSAWQRNEEGRWRMRLGGPVSDPATGALFGVVQRIADRGAGLHRVGIALHADQPLVLLLSVCERYLIYDRRCQWRRVPVPAAEPGAPAQWVEAQLQGNLLEADGLLARWRPRMFGISVLTPGATADVQRISLESPRGEPLLENGDFLHGPTRWVAAAQGRFEPWHIDNLYLQFWLERGLLGAGALLMLLVLALHRAHAGVLARPHEAPALLGGLLALTLLGMFVSVGEMPRLTLLLWLVLGASLQLKPKTSHIRRM